MSYLKYIWKVWLKIGKKIGHFQALILFTLFYFFVLWMVGIFIALFSDRLNIKPKNRKSNFIAWNHNVPDVKEAQKPY